MAACLRGTLRAALVAALAALAACSSSSSGPGGSPPPACKGVDHACAVGTECCSGDCPVGACGCSAVGERCGTSLDCCTGSGPARCQSGACVAGPRPLGDVCDWDGDCATLNCDLTGHCAPACLSTIGAACTQSAQCCTGMGCPAGTCTLACGRTYDACTVDNQCCSDYRCRAGECQEGQCGTAGQRCDSNADCCTAAQGGKDFFCNSYGNCDIGRPSDWPGTPPDACETDADCAGDSPCRGGYCHWPDGHQPDGHWCLDGQECDGGHCTATQPGVPGTCCSGAGAACSASGGATICCSGLELACVGTAGAQSCGSCLDFTNSGPQGTLETQCTTSSQCCTGRNLTCAGGECCTGRGAACTPGSGSAECCDARTDTCGDVTNDPYVGSRTNVCCGDFGAACGLANPCCDGFLCTGGVCLEGPGMACTGGAQCAQYEGCKVVPPQTEGVCCSHDMGRCDADADCCSGSCDPVMHSCNFSQEYGACLDDSDCSSASFGQWNDGPVCGGNANLPPLTCCPVPGDTCLSAADCCEAGDSCKPPLYGADTTTPRCCRETQSSASEGSQCCTGMAERRSSTSVVQTCCAYPWMTTFTCTSTADCCSASSTGFIGSRCEASRCCWESGFQIGAGDPALCCSGRARSGACQ